MCPINGMQDEDLDLNLLNSFSALLKKENNPQNLLKKSSKELMKVEEAQNEDPLPGGEILKLQQKANQMATNLLNSPLAARGEFKLVVPLDNRYAIAIVYHSKGTKEEDKKMLRRECGYLNFLSQSGFPVIKIYGDVFEFGQEKYAAVIMDWWPHEWMIEGKHPDAIKTLLPAMLLGVKIPKGEGWVMQYDRICQQVDSNILNGVVTLTSVKEKISKLMNSFSKLMERLESTQIKIADLQMLVDDEQRLSIIDPLAVFYAQESNTKQFVDVLDQTKKAFAADMQLSQSMASTTQMLYNIQSWLASAAKVNSLTEIKDLFLLTSQTEEKLKKPSSRMSPLFKEFMKPRIDFKMRVGNADVSYQSTSGLSMDESNGTTVFPKLVSESISAVIDLDEEIALEKPTESFSLNYQKTTKLSKN